MEKALLEKEVVSNLWNAYRKTDVYGSGAKKAIPKNHPLVQKAEVEGLKIVYGSWARKLKRSNNIQAELVDRSIADWTNAWKKSHAKLFSYVLKDRGNFRKILIRFGSPGDEVLHRIPQPYQVVREMNGLANSIRKILEISESTYDEQLIILAKTHYQFIRIHPFSDGNGRLARFLTDQLALSYGLPPSIAGYPRHDKKKRAEYHKAITSCITNPECTDLALWIRGYVDKQLQELA